MRSSIFLTAFAFASTRSCSQSEARVPSGTRFPWILPIPFFLTAWHVSTKESERQPLNSRPESHPRRGSIETVHIPILTASHTSTRESDMQPLNLMPCSMFRQREPKLCLVSSPCISAEATYDARVSDLICCQRVVIITRNVVFPLHAALLIPPA